MLETDKEIQNMGFGYSAVTVEMKRLAENRSAKTPNWLNSFKLSCRNMEHVVENKGVGERKDTIFQQISSPQFFQMLQEAKNWDFGFFSMGRCMWS